MKRYILGYTPRVTKFMIEQQIAQSLQSKEIKIGTLTEIWQWTDLAIVISDHSNTLSVARTLARYNTKVININYSNSNLCFLTGTD